MTAGDSVTFSGLDGAIVASFFISYSVLALTQISNLFNQKLTLFFSLTLIGLIAAVGVKGLDFTELCETRTSAILCNKGGDALREFAIVWVYISIAMLVLFLLSRAIQRMKGKRCSATATRARSEKSCCLRPSRSRDLLGAVVFFLSVGVGWGCLVPLAPRGARARARVPRIVNI